MKKVLLPFLVFIVFASSAFSQILNAGFESWTNGSPDNWLSTNLVGFATPVTQSETEHSGNYAAYGEVIYVPLLEDNLYPAVFSAPGTGGFPIDQRYQTISGWYQFSPQGEDRFSVDAVLYNNSTAVAVAAIADPTTVGSYTQFSADFEYLNDETPNYLYLIITIIGPEGDDYHLGSSFLVDDVSISGNVPVSAEEITGNLPSTFELSQNYPNPFNPSTVIEFSLPEESFVALRVYDILGKEVQTLAQDVYAAGTFKAGFIAANLPSGIYIAKLDASSVKGNFSIQKSVKMTLMK